MSKKPHPLYGLINYKPLDTWDTVLVKERLDELYQEALRLADDRISWYRTYGRTKGTAAKRIKWFAIILFVVSTLMPYLSIPFGTGTTSQAGGPAMQSAHASWFLYAGYLMAGIGAGLLMLDKFYGYSSSWTRFVLTGLDLTKMRNDFAETWQVIYFNNLPMSVAGFSTMVEVILKFQDNFQETVKAETETWAKEFQDGLRELTAALKAQSENFKAEIGQQRLQSTANAAADPSAKEIALLPMTEQFALVKQAIAENRESWKTTIKNYTGVAVGIKVRGNNQVIVNPGSYCIQFSVSTKEVLNTSGVNTVPEVVFSHGFRIPTDVVETGKITGSIFSAENLPIPKPLGCSIGRQNVPLAGTIGLRVKLADGLLYGMSCFHVLFSEEMKAHTYRIDKNQADKIIDSAEVCSPAVIDGSALNFLGAVSHGAISKTMDCAFFLTTKEDIDDNIHEMPLATKIHDLDSQDQMTLKVKFCGRSSGKVTDGIVFANSASPEVTYFNQMSLDFTDMIQLKITAEQGDSGAVVLTEKNELLGMIFAVGAGYAYAIPMRGIYNTYPFTVA